MDEGEVRVRGRRGELPKDEHRIRRLGVGDIRTASGRNKECDDRRRRGERCGNVFGRDREGEGNASGGSAVVYGGDSERGGSRGEGEESKGVGDERRGDGEGVGREIQGGTRRREATEFVRVIGGIRGCDEL